MTETPELRSVTNERERPLGGAEYSEGIVRDAQKSVEELLVQHRAERDEINAKIKTLVAEGEVLERAVRVFERWHDTRTDGAQS